MIAASHQAAQNGFPLVVRGDVLFPEHANDGARDNTQCVCTSGTIASRVILLPPVL